MALTSANICSSLRTMPILDDDVVRMCPTDPIGWGNRGTKGVRLGQTLLREPVSDYYCSLLDIHLMCTLPVRYTEIRFRPPIYTVFSAQYIYIYIYIYYIYMIYYIYLYLIYSMHILYALYYILYSEYWILNTEYWILNTIYYIL